MTKYRTIVADPPWDHSDGTGASYSTKGRRDCGLPYQTMTLDEIKNLPVSEWAMPGAHLYLWTTNRYLKAAFEVSKAWGFDHVATLVWCKQRGLGSGGVFYSNVEFVLYCRNKGDAGIPNAARIKSRWFDWPRSSHSAKPEAFLDLVEQASHGPFLEMFARRARFGWDYWGDESLGTAEIAS